MLRVYSLILGRESCTVLSISAQISQKEIKLPKLKCDLRTYCPNIYCDTVKYQDYWAYVSCPSSAARRSDRAAVAGVARASIAVKCGRRVCGAAPKSMQKS